MNIIFPNLPWYLWIILISIVLIISFFIWVKIFFSKEIQTKIAIQKVNKYFSYLFERGFRMQQADYYPEGNGAWAIILESEDCKLRINQDRGGVSCEITPIWANKYEDLYRVVIAIEKKPENIKISQVKPDIDSQLEFYATLFSTYFNQVVSSLKIYQKPL